MPLYGKRKKARSLPTEHRTFSFITQMRFTKKRGGEMKYVTLFLFALAIGGVAQASSSLLSIGDDSLKMLPLMVGHERGNGGDAVVCRDHDDKIISVELLDFFEARNMRGIYLDLGDDSLSVDQKVQL